MTWLNKPQLKAFLQQNTDGVCSAGGTHLDGVQLETAPAFRRTNSAAATGTIPTPNPQLCLHLSAGDNGGTKGNFITFLGSMWCVLWNRGQAMDTVEAKVG